jgi:hypothetical protein
MKVKATDATKSCLPRPMAWKYRTSGVAGELVTPPTTPARKPAGAESHRSQ